MKPRRPTRKDVAALAGVAPSTVGLVLQDKGDALRIPTATQERVREAARSLGYVPNRHMRSLLRGRSGIVGLYLRADQWSRPYGYFSTLRWHLERAVSERDLQLLVHNAAPDCSAEEAFARQAGGIVDGVIILNSGPDPIVERLVNAGLPAVELGDTHSRLPFVGVDSEAGVQVAMAHLAERGYLRPAFLGHVTHYVADARTRIEAFERDAQARFEMARPEARVVQAHDGAVGLGAILAMEPPPDAVLCASDELAYELLHAATARQLRVPEELAIVGFDALDAFGAPRRVTSVATPLEAMARLAVEKLLAIVDGEPYERATILKPVVSVGATT